MTTHQALRTSAGADAVAQRVIKNGHLRGFGRPEMPRPTREPKANAR